MLITWAHRVATIVKIWEAFRYHIMACRPLSTVIIRMRVKCPTNAYRMRQVVAFHPHSMDIIITIIIRRRAQQVAMVRQISKEMSWHRQTQVAPMQRTIAPSIRTNRHHFCCPLNCIKVYLPMLYFIVRIKCAHIHFLAIYYFHIRTNHRIPPTLNMMKNPQLRLRLVCLCWIGKVCITGYRIDLIRVEFFWNNIFWKKLQIKNR